MYKTQFKSTFINFCVHNAKILDKTMKYNFDKMN